MNLLFWLAGAESSRVIWLDRAGVKMIYIV